MWPVTTDCKRVSRRHKVRRSRLLPRTGRAGRSGSPPGACLVHVKHEHGSKPELDCAL